LGNIIRRPIENSNNKYSVHTKLCKTHLKLMIINVFAFSIVLTLARAQMGLLVKNWQWKFWTISIM